MIWPELLPLYAQSAGLESSVAAWPSVFNIGNCAIGAGILSFPYAIAKSGLFGGTAMCILVALIELLTLYILMRQSTKHRAMTYQGLVRFLPPPMSVSVVTCAHCMPALAQVVHARAAHRSTRALC